MSKTYYVTTPIYYVNDVPHVGHAYTTIAADALTRARRLQGHRVFFLTGTDEHGQNISRVAREKGVGEQEYCDKIAARFKALFERYDLRYDDFIRTTEDRHTRGVLKFWARLVKTTAPNGQPAVYRAKYSGWYCPRCESFKTEDEVTPPGNLCKDHGLPCEWTEEENFFFRLSAYSDWLRGEITSARLKIDPEGRRNEVLAVLDQGLQDFSVSRARVKWGIPVPEEPSHVFYVWVDALSNYITALGYADDKPEYKTFWEGTDERFHLMGKEIIRFHCLYWPAMLHAAGLPVPSRIFAHGHLTKDGKKLSKSTGNVIDPEALVAQWGPDPVRYFLLREGSFGQDWDFTETAFVGRYNSDLANDLGNLGSRTLTMVRNYCGGKVPARPAASTEGSAGFEAVFQTSVESMTAEVFAKYEACDFAGALSVVWSWIGQLNQRIAQVEPWVLAKDPARRGELDAVLYRWFEALRIVTLMASPVIPRAAARIYKMMGLEWRAPGPADLRWGLLEPGTALGATVAVFPRIEKEKKVSDTPNPPAVPPPATTPAAVSADGLVDISEFARIELKVAKIIAAEKIEGAKKLLKLQVDLGTEQRQIVAGIAEAYAPETLVGRTIAVVANLKPAKLRGVESQGMLLAASIGDKPVLCTFDQEVPPGTKIK